MKKMLFLLLVGMLLSSTTFAQTQKGHLFVSGGAGLVSTFTSQTPVYDGKSGDNTTGHSITLLPSLGYFVIDNLSIGLAGNIVYSSSKSESGNKSVSNQILLTPVAIYFFPVEGKIKPLAQVGIGLALMTEKYIPKNGDDQKYAYGGPNFNIGAGISYFVKENISFNFGLSYTKVVLTDSDDTKSQMKQGNFGNNIGIAIYF